MTQRSFLKILLSFLCITAQLSCQEEPDPNEPPLEQIEDEIDDEIEFEDFEDIIEHVDDEFDAFEEEDGVITEEMGPIGTPYYVDIANGKIEEWNDRYTREDSYFTGLDNHLSDETVHVEHH